MDKYITKTEALRKLQQYCAYQDRCHKEVRSKLLDLGIRGYDLEDIMASLVEDKFLDEERYARSFVRGKFRIKKWGRIKIKEALWDKQLSAYCLRKGFEEIDENEYYQTLLEIIAKKDKTLAASTSLERQQKLAKFAIRRGFESHLAWQAVQEFLAE